MKKIFYYDGKKNIEIEAEEKLAKDFQEIKKAEWRLEKSLKKSLSLESLVEAGMQFEEAGGNFEELLIAKEEQKERKKLLFVLKKALKILNTDQQNIIKMKFFEGKNDTDISRIIGISRQAVQCRLETIFAKIKKFIKNALHFAFLVPNK